MSISSSIMECSLAILYSEMYSDSLKEDQLEKKEGMEKRKEMGKNSKSGG